MARQGRAGHGAAGLGKAGLGMGSYGHSDEFPRQGKAWPGGARLGLA